MRFKQFSFHKKLFLSCSILNSVLLAVCAAFFYYYTASSLRSNMRSTLTGSASMISKDIDNLLEDADRLLKELQLNATLLEDVKKVTESDTNFLPTHINIRTDFQNKFHSAILSSDLKMSLGYISPYYDNLYISTVAGTNYCSKEQLEENADLVNIMNNIDYFIFVPPHESYQSKGKTVISAVRSMRTIYDQYGILIADFDISSITAFLSEFEKPEDYSITILDENRNISYTNDSFLNSDDFYSAWKKAGGTSVSSGSFSYGDTILYSFHTSEKTGWTLFLSENFSSLRGSLSHLFLVSATLFVILFVIMSVFLLLLTRQLTFPLRQLTSRLTSLGPGSNIEAIPVPGNNEITILTNAIQGYLSEIYEQNQRLTEERHRTLIAHYDAMEAQMNPHFLYNTLSVIGLTGLAAGSAEVSTMCSRLSMLLRYSLSYTGQSVTLGQEIENAGHYLYIMKIRYEEDLEYHWELDQTLDTLPVPKLILQPLIENCFQHGFHQPDKEIPPPWRIIIRSYTDQSHWYLSVLNNGATFQKEKLDKIRNRIRSFSPLDTESGKTNDFIERQGYGLENTILRLHIYYRGEELFDVIQTQNDYTAVLIGGPLKPEKSFNRNFP